MSLSGFSQSTITLWATKNFPMDFQQLPGARQVVIRLHKIFSPEGQAYIKGLVIGTGTNEKGLSTEILAWLDKSSVVIGYVTNVGSHTRETRFDSIESVMESVTEFKEPFNCIIQVEGEATFAKLEALVRYFFLLKGLTQAVKDRIGDFEEHFGNACRDIAAAQGVEREEPRDISPGAGENARNSSGSPNKHSLYDFEIFVEGLRTTSSEANMSSQSPKTPITRPRNKGTRGLEDTPDPGPASRQSNIRFDTDNASLELDPQDSAKFEIKNLRRKVQALDNRLMMAEGRARKAEQDAAMWRGSYEQLRKRMDGNNSA